MSPLLNAVHFFCAAYMTGIIWFVQRVHYPMLHLSNGPNAAGGHAEYTRRMGVVVMPVMLAELGLQLHWTLRQPSSASWTGAGLLLTVWLSTFLLQVPCHTRLQEHFDPAVQRKLVLSNWIRTLAWSARALLLGAQFGG